MKKWILVLALIFVCGIAYGDASTPRASYFSTQEVLNRLHDRTTNSFQTSESNRSGTLILHRENISDDDSANNLPAPGLDNTGVGIGVDLTGWKKAVVQVKVSTDTGCIITPMFGNSTATRYFEGDQEQVSNDSSFVIEVNGEDDFYVSIEDVSGTDLIDIYVQGTN